MDCPVRQYTTRNLPANRSWWQNEGYRFGRMKWTDISEGCFQRTWFASWDRLHLKLQIHRWKAAETQVILINTRACPWDGTEGLKFVSCLIVCNFTSYRIFWSWLPTLFAPHDRVHIVSVPQCGDARSKKIRLVGPFLSDN